MSTGAPLTPDEREQIRALHAEGHGRNEIARRTGRSWGAITNAANDLGLSFDRSETAAATAARKADLQEMRSQLALDLIEDAQRLRLQMWKPAVVYAFGGKEGLYSEEPVDEPPPVDKRALMATAATAIDRSLKLSPQSDGTGLDQAKSMLGDIGAALTEFVRAEDEHADGEE